MTKGQDCLDGTHSLPFVSITVKDAITKEVLSVFEGLMLSRIGGYARDAQFFLYPVALFKMIETGCENEFYVTFVNGDDLEGLRFREGGTWRHGAHLVIPEYSQVQGELAMLFKHLPIELEDIVLLGGLCEQQHNIYVTRIAPLDASDGPCAEAACLEVLDVSSPGGADGDEERD